MRTLKEKQAALAAATAAFAKASKSDTWGGAFKWFDGLSGVETITVDGKDKFSLKAVETDGKKAIQVLLSVSEDGSGAEVLDVQAADAPMEEGEPEGETAQALKTFTAGKTAMIVDGQNKIDNMGGGKAIEKSGRLVAQKAYERAYKSGGVINTAKGPIRPSYGDYEMAEAAGAWMRVAATNAGANVKTGWGYSQRANDLDILKKIGLTTDNSNAGGFVPPEFISGTFIDNLNTFGVAPQVVSFINSSTDNPWMNKNSTRPTVYLQGTEGSSLTKSNGAISQVQLSLRTMYNLGDFSQQLWDDSATNVGEWFSQNSAQAHAEAIDEEFFLGTKWSTGDSIDDHVGANNTSDTGAGSLAAVTMDQIQTATSKLQGEALMNGEIKYAMSPQVWESVFSRFTQNSGGPRRDDLASGSGGNIRSFNGTNNVYLSNVLYEAAVDGMTLFYAGDFNAGVVAARRKDIEIKFSDEALFGSYGVQGRAVQRCWWNIHGVNNTANGSQVIKCTL